MKKNYKRLPALSAVLLLSTALSYGQAGMIMGTNAREWTVNYAAGLDKELGEDFAALVSSCISKATGAEPKIAAPGEKDGRNRIDLVVLEDSFKYSIRTGKNSIEIKAGGIWAAEYALKQFCETLSAKGIGKKYSISGTVEGLELFPLPEDANFRIVDDNIWQYDSENIPQTWEELGADPTNEVRSRGFAQLIRAWMPDVVTLQEYSPAMHSFLGPLLKAYGYESVLREESNFTPIFYNTATVKVLKAEYHSYQKADYEGLAFERDDDKTSADGNYNNHGTKSYTIAAVETKDGKRMAVCSTHLWYKKNEGAKKAQLNLALNALDSLSAKYCCPAVLCGDLNCNEGSIAVKSAFERGWKPCYELATGKTEAPDAHNGHHKCSAKDGFTRQEHKWRENTRKGGAIDHILLGDKTEAEVRNFICLTPEFTVRLTDHYPYAVDFKL